MRETSCAAASDPPPRSKKSAVRDGTGIPSTDCHCSASHASRAGEVDRGGFHARQRPRQRRAIDLARRAHRQVVDDAPAAARSPAGRRSASSSPRRAAVEFAGCRDHEVADEHGHPGVRGPHGRGRGRDTRQVLQRGLHLAELDPPPADLDLIVGAALEDEPLGVEAHEVARAVGALPAERGHRRVLLGILRRVEVAGEPDAADDELTRLALGDRLSLGIDDGERPAVERQSDAHRARRRRAAPHTPRRSPRSGRTCSRPRARRRRAARRARAGTPRRRRSAAARSRSNPSATSRPASARSRRQ